MSDAQPGCGCQRCHSMSRLKQDAGVRFRRMEDMERKETEGLLPTAAGYPDCPFACAIVVHRDVRQPPMVDLGRFR